MDDPDSPTPRNSAAFGIRRWTEHLHPRDEEGQWREVIGKLPEREARASTGGNQRLTSRQINPGMKRRDLGYRTIETGTRRGNKTAAQVAPADSPEALQADRATREAASRGEPLETLNAEREQYGLPPLKEVVRKNKRGVPFRRGVIIPAAAPPPGSPDTVPWPENGADLRNLDDATIAKMFENIKKFKGIDPNMATTVEQMTENIIAAFDSASPQEAAYGERWYANAAEQAMQLAQKYHVDPHLVAALIAATSPRTDWDSNIVAAELVLESLLPETSPAITPKFLNTRMTVDTDLNGNPLKPGQKPPTGLEYILNRASVRASFEKKHPQEAVKTTVIDKNGKNKTVWVPTEPDEAYKARIDGLIMDALNQENPDGSPMQLYQFRNRALRAALMDINNRAVAEKRPGHIPGMGMPVLVTSADGYVMQGRRRSFSRVLATQFPAIDRLFGYEELDPFTEHLPQGWSGVPTDAEELHQRIDETLGGHKTRSFYDNIITSGKSNFATIDVHALRAALLGKGATRAGASIPGSEALLDDTGDTDPDNFRVGAYAVVNEAFRRAAQEINRRRVTQGEPPLSVAQVQAVAWIASRPESIAGTFSHIAVQQRDPERRDARVLPFIPEEQRSTAMQRIADSRTYEQAQTRLATAGINVAPEMFDEAAYNRAKMSLKTPMEEFKAYKDPDSMNLNIQGLTTASWLMSVFESDEEVAKRMRSMFASKEGPAKFTSEDAALLRRILSDRYTAEELAGQASAASVREQLDAFNARRRESGVPDSGTLTYNEFRKFMKSGDYV